MNPIFYSPLYCELTCLPFYCYSPFLPFSFYPTFINSTLATSSMSLQYFYLFSPKPLIFFPSFHCISPFHSQTSGFVSIRISSIKRSISYPVSCSLPYLIMASWFVHWTSFSFSFGYYDLFGKLSWEHFSNYRKQHICAYKFMLRVLFFLPLPVFKMYD